MNVFFSAYVKKRDKFYDVLTSTNKGREEDLKLEAIESKLSEILWEKLNLKLPEKKEFYFECDLDLKKKEILEVTNSKLIQINP